jgi:hypothetical protein
MEIPLQRVFVEHGPVYQNAVVGRNKSDDKKAMTNRNSGGVVNYVRFLFYV